MRRIIVKRNSHIFLFVLVIFSLPIWLQAGVAEDLQSKIDDRSNQIKALEAEIAKYQDELDRTGKAKQNLQSAINSLTISEKKLQAELKITQNKITSTNLRLDELALGIKDKNIRLAKNTEAIGQSIRNLSALETDTIIESLLNYRTISEFWNIADSLAQLQKTIKQNSDEARQLKANLENTKTEVEAQKKQLIALKNKQADQQQIIAENKKEKNILLSETKNKESNYQRLLSDKLALKEAFEREVLEYESQLKFELDPNTLPKIGSGVLSWPLDKVTITQYFGKTAFAQSGAYNGQGHNGIDLRASIGTTVKASLGGTVIGSGNTDTVCKGASYGKWILIEHNNGLTTLYAHLSLIKVADGQTVGTGQIIGYSGQTGYATGPHLHLTVFATKAVAVTQIKSKVCRGTYTIPVANVKGYLNPLAYL